MKTENDKGVRGRNPALIVERFHAPWWCIMLLPLPLWTVWVYALGPSPTPQWMHTTAICAVVAPVAALFLASVVMYRMSLRPKFDALREIGLREQNITARREARDWVADTIDFDSSFRRARVIRVWRSKVASSRMQYVEFMTTHGRSQRTWFTLTLQTAEAPGSVTITPRSLWRSLWGSKSEPRVGPDWFAEEWMIRGDDEAISQLLREDVLISLDDDSFRRHHHWIWRGHELTLLVRGWPTAEGVRTAAIMLLNIVQPSGILPNDNRPAGPGG